MSYVKLLDVYLDTPIIFEASDLPRRFPDELFFASLGPSFLTEGLLDDLVADVKRGLTQSQLLKSLKNEVGQLKGNVAKKFLDWADKVAEKSKVPPPKPDVTSASKPEQDAQPAKEDAKQDVKEQDANPKSEVRPEVKKQILDTLNLMAQKYPRKSVKEIVQRISQSWDEDPAKYIGWINNKIIKSLERESKIADRFAKKLINQTPQIS